MVFKFCAIFLWPLRATSFLYETNVPQILNLDAVDPGTKEFFAVDNGAYKHRDVCGSISWQIRVAIQSADPLSRLFFGQKIS